MKLINWQLLHPLNFLYVVATVFVGTSILFLIFGSSSTNPTE